MKIRPLHDRVIVKRLSQQGRAARLGLNIVIDDDDPIGFRPVHRGISRRCRTAVFAQANNLNLGKLSFGHLRTAVVGCIVEHDRLV